MSNHLDNVTELPKVLKPGAGDGVRGGPGRTAAMMTTEPETNGELPGNNMLSAVDARQGVVSGRVLLVLLTSVVLAVVALGIVYFVT